VFTFRNGRRLTSRLLIPDAEAAGELIKEITAAIRRYKSENGMALMQNLQVSGYIHPWKMLLISLARQIPRSCSNRTPDFETVPTALKPNMKVLGKTYRSKAKQIAETLIKADPNLLPQVALRLLWMMKI